MKKLQGFVAAPLLLLAIAGCLFSASAQTQFQSASDAPLLELPPEPQLLAPEDVPVAGTFFMLSDFQQDFSGSPFGGPPYPCNPFFNAPVYSTAAQDVYIVDDSEARPGLFEPVENPDLATLEIWGRVQALVDHIQQLRQQRSLRMSSSLMTTDEVSLDPTIPGDGDGSTNEWYPEITYTPPVYGSNDLFLSIGRMHDGLAEVTLHGVQDTNVYMLASSPDLSHGIWQTEDVLRPTIGSTQVTAGVSLFNRPSLFFKARTWNEITSSGIPRVVVVVLFWNPRLEFITRIYSSRASIRLPTRHGTQPD